jgi:2-oxoglutarate ferredoxin oxidoreductase subunit delta
VSSGNATAGHDSPGTTAAASVPARGHGGVLTRGTVTIDRERCKGCELCIPACRPGVLTMSVEVNAIGYRFPELAAGCTGCRACHAVCPDYVFEVYKYDEPIVLPASEESTEEGEG